MLHEDACAESGKCHNHTLSHNACGTVYQSAGRPKSVTIFINEPFVISQIFYINQILTISPQNIDDDALLLLADTKLKHLHLLQNRYTSTYLSISPCSVKVWRQLKRDNPRLKVHLRVESLGEGEVVFQPEAPVCSVTYESPKSKVSGSEH